MRKKSFIKTLLAGLLLGILAVSSAVSSILIDEAEKLSWNTKNIGALKALFPNAASVETLLTEITPNIAKGGWQVGEYEFTDLGNNGNLELLATIDVTGRKIYNTVYVVQKVNNSLISYELWAPGANIDDLKSHIVDLNDDGHKEFLLPRVLDYTNLGMVHPRPIINDVYAWDKTGFRKANASFKNYYRSLLPRLNAEYEAVVKGKKVDDPDDPSERDLLKKKYEREIEEVNKILNE